MRNGVLKNKVGQNLLEYSKKVGELREIHWLYIEHYKLSIKNNYKP